MCRDDRPPRFQPVKAPYKSELEDLVQLINHYYLFSQDANLQPQRSTSNHATEKRVARAVGCYRSGMDGSALCDHSYRQTFSEADRLALLFIGAVTRIGEATFT